MFLFLYYSLGVEKTNTFIRSRGSLENHTRFKTIMVKIYTRFQTKTARKPYPLGRHSLHRGVPPPPPVPTPERKLMSEVILVCKLILINPATSASVERPFSTTQRLKRWFRSTMTRERFTNLTILNRHKERTNKHPRPLVDLAYEFSDRSDNRRRYFGIFKESDMH